MKEVVPFLCPICKSNWRSIGTSSSGYSMKKGILGSALLGPVGAVAGINGKKQITYQCPKCGYTKSYQQ